MIIARGVAAWIVAVAAAGTSAACTEPATVEEEEEATPEDAAPADEAVRVASEQGDPGYDPQSGWGSACRAACWGAAALGCSAVSVACAGTTTITIGGTAIPCSWAIIAACTGSAAGASLCSDKCPP